MGTCPGARLEAKTAREEARKMVLSLHPAKHGHEIGGTMQTIIGQFQSASDAESALRMLEANGFSIQNMVIADREHRAWRRLAGASEDGELEANFVVFSMDDAETSAHARAKLLHLMQYRVED
jgi:hypothetical protein